MVQDAAQKELQLLGWGGGNVAHRYSQRTSRGGPRKDCARRKGSTLNVDARTHLGLETPELEEERPGPGLSELQGLRRPLRTPQSPHHSAPSKPDHPSANLRLCDRDHTGPPGGV